MVGRHPYHPCTSPYNLENSMEKYNTIKVSKTQTDYLFESKNELEKFINSIDRRLIPYDMVTVNKNIASVYYQQG